MMSIILLSCISLQACVAVYLFNLFRPKDRFEKTFNIFLILLLAHLAVKLSLLMVWKNAFLYNNNPSGFSFAYGPLLYLATLFYLNREVSVRKVLLHMMPFCINLLVCLITSEGYLEGVISPEFMHMYAKVYEEGAILSLIVYPLLSWHMLKGVAHTPADPKRKLLVAFVRTILAAILLGLASMVVYGIKTGRWDLNFWILTYLSYVWLIVMTLRYKIESLSTVAVEHEEQLQPESEPESQPLRQYKKSGLDEEMMDGYEHSIRVLMQQSRIYLEPELSLEELSVRAGIPKHHITQLLNERFNKNFYTFINEYRIEMAVNKLKNPSLDINLISLAYDCGFNSKSSFNNYFKKITGVTPSVYRKNCQQNAPVTIT
ncbi:MAG TPA: helix-turn-helix domain-containing protein [Chitinophaga sp.]|uniref:helix-turn-helix domain-containing protein n=1 Tax=Chitinophaga sp. TaxID=1869181 RepID=UPI002C4E934A|nr:helix-turn-helix domain-containing protein [Chitinophaga sp.]HVI49265.1 helix-turn-helix domain-containing protein [Chitinophaga sp.]